MNIPVLLVFFNRGDTVLQLINSLRDVKPQAIYLASDGARNAREKKMVEIIRTQVLAAIDWECKVHCRFSEQNYGCKQGVHQAVQWFFSHTEKGIVLEDDCIPTAFFFDYCNAMLNQYENDLNVATITGRNELSSFGDDSHFFSSKFFCWGWASWADRIVGVDVEHGYRKNAVKCIENKSLSYAEKNHVKGIHNLMLTKEVNSWAYSYDLYFRSKNMLHILPKLNLIKNIGVGAEGTHHGSKSADDTSISNITFPLDKLIERKVSKKFMSTYFKHVYSPFKLFFFPIIGYIKKIRKMVVK